MAEAPNKQSKVTVKKAWGGNLKGELQKLKDLMEHYKKTYPGSGNEEYALIADGAGIDTKYILGRKNGDKVEPVPRDDSKCFKDPVAGSFSTLQAPFHQPYLTQGSSTNYQQQISSPQTLTIKEEKPRPGRKEDPVFISVITHTGKKIDLNNNALLFLKNKTDSRGISTMTYDGEDVDFDMPRIIKDIQHGVKIIDLRQKMSKAANSRSFLFTILSPKGKRIEFTSAMYERLQKQADGNGKKNFVHEGETFEINVIDVKKAYESGKKVMEIPPPKLVKNPLNIAALTAVYSQLDNALNKNKQFFKKPKM